ncbi:LPS export ABC transporter permease LptG [Nereida sp. NH-UV-3]|uniref:LPS export ABC transporter permease LptG n=1 Tax=Nereida TaxID=282198 RepID=UPI0036F257A9
MTLHLYFAIKFLRSFLVVGAIFFAVLLLIDVLEQVRRFSDADVSFAGILGLAALNVPSGLYTILPLITIIATLTLFLGLARTSELVITRAAGRSALLSLLAPIVVAAGLGALSVSVLNPLVAATSKQYEENAARYTDGAASVLSVSDEGLWLRQGDLRGQTVIHAQQSSADGTRLVNAMFLAYSEDGLPITRVNAVEAVLTYGAWRLRDAKTWRLNDPNPERTAITAEMLTIPTDLTRDRIQDSFGTPSAVPIWALPRFIADLETAGFSALSYRIWYHMELALPLFLIAMVLIGAVFTMRHVRFGKTGQMVLYAIMMGFGAFFLRNLAQVLGENGQIPIILAAWAPPIAAICLAIAMLLHLEDG